MRIGIKPRKLLTRPCINGSPLCNKGRQGVDRLVIEAADCSHPIALADFYLSMGEAMDTFIRTLDAGVACNQSAPARRAYGAVASATNALESQ